LKFFRSKFIVSFFLLLHVLYWQFGIVQVLAAKESTYLPSETTSESSLICESGYLTQNYYLNSSVLITSDICSLLQIKGEAKLLIPSQNDFENIIEVLAEISDYYIFAKTDDTVFLYLSPRSPPINHISV
jgi:hypothetical protein